MNIFGQNINGWPLVGLLLVGAVGAGAFWLLVTVVFQLEEILR